MMRFLPDVFTDTFEDMWKDPFFTKSSSCMKTDVHEIDGNYLLDMELPGYKKEDIHLELKDGYLNITAAKNSSNEEKDDKGNIIRQERYSGSCARSFYVGDSIREEDIGASFDNGELKITFPKEESRKVEEKRFIPIE